MMHAPSRSRSRVPRAGLVAVLLLFLGACAAPRPDTGAPTGQRARPTAQPGGGTPVSVQPVEQGPITTTISYAGNVQSYYSVQVTPNATGQVEQLLADVGSVVKSGDLLAVLDRSQLQASVEQARGGLNTAEAKLAATLAQGRPEAVDQAQSQLAAAEQKLALMLEGGRPGDVAAAETNAAAAQTKVAQVMEATRAQVASAQATVDTNRANLRSAQAKLDELLGGGAPSDRAQAEAGVESARGGLEQAQGQRDLLVNPPAATVESARSQLATAESSLATARANLDQLMSGGAPSDRAQAESGVESAYSGLRQAQENLAVLMAGGTGSQRGQAIGNVQSAQSQLRAARTQYQQLTQPPPGNNSMSLQRQALQQQRDLDTAQSQANAACGSNGGSAATANVSGVSISLSGVTSGLECASAQSEVNRLQTSLSLTEVALQLSGTIASRIDVTQARAQVDAAAANVLAADTALADLNRPPPNSAQSARTAVEQAQANLDTAVAKLDALRNPPTASRVQAETAVSQAEASLRAARENYQQTVAGGSPAQRRSADGAVDAALGTLQQAQAKLDGLRNPSAADVASARTAVENATAQLAASEEQLALQTGPQAKSDLDAAMASLQQSQNTLYDTRFPNREQELQQQRETVRQARAGLVLAQTPNRPEDVAQARAGVEQARGQYNLAVAQESNAYVYAPFDGMISSRLVSVGTLANPSTALYNLVSSNVQVWVNVEENDLTIVRPGVPALMTVSPYRGETFSASVDVVAPSGDSKSRTFATKLVAANPDGRLKDGMFAQLRFEGLSRSNAVLVPLNALVQRGGLNFAYVVVDGRARQREVKLGINDGVNFEVLSGLQPGEQLIVQGLSTVSDGVPVTITSAAPRAQAIAQ